jgi:flagellar hook-length control protein FliK
VSPAQPASAVQPASGAPVAQATPVPLARAAETVEHVLRLAAARGVTHARVMLRPAELGSIDIHLRQTAEGLAARVVATTPEAVAQLQQAASDLRRSLEQQGVTLLSLDIGQSGDERSAGRSGEGMADGGADGERGTGEAGSAEAEEVTTQSTLRLPDGVLVDVLA